MGNVVREPHMVSGPREVSYWGSTSALLHLGQDWVPRVLYSAALVLLHNELMTGRRRGGQSIQKGVEEREHGGNYI